MAKIPRKVAKQFGSTAGAQQIGVYGSFAAGSAAYSTDPDTIQGLSNYLSGWFSAVVGSNSPAIEDVNALDFLWSYQLAYIMQAGIPEWNAQTTYYIGSIATGVGTGILYRSIQNTNLNHAVSDTAWWELVVQTTAATPTRQAFTSGSGTYTTPAGARYLHVKMVGGGGGGGGQSGFGGDGADTTFGTATAGFGGGGHPAAGSDSGGGAGGVGSLGSFTSGRIIHGGNGDSKNNNGNAGGGTGAPTPYAGWGAGGYGGSNGADAQGANTGSGGGGSSGTGGSSPGGGGGAAAYLELFITTPASTYAYSVGAKGTAGTGSPAGGNGSDGFIEVLEYY
jgi:hypothetical protein